MIDSLEHYLNMCYSIAFHGAHNPAVKALQKRNAKALKANKRDVRAVKVSKRDVVALKAKEAVGNFHDENIKQ